MNKYCVKICTKDGTNMEFFAKSWERGNVKPGGPEHGFLIFKNDEDVVTIVRSDYVKSFSCLHAR